MQLKETLKYLKLRESVISMILGALVIVIGGIVFTNYLAKRSTPSQDVIKIGDEEIATQKNHIVAKDESLSQIARQHYGDPTKWTIIAEANKITNSDSIIEGQSLTIPEVSGEGQIAIVSPTASLSITSTPTPTITISPTNSPTATTIPTQAVSATIAPSATPAPTLTPAPSATPTVITDDGQGASSTEAKTHKVTKGEDLWKIAEKHYNSGYNWTDIANANRLANPNRLTADQELIIPNVPAKTITTTTQETANAISGASYTVEKGDNLWTIAVRAYGDGYKWAQIAKENSLTNPNIIVPGKVLSLPR